MNKIEKCRNTQLNRIVIHKNEEEKRIYRYELETYLSNGWSKGISDKHRNTNAKKHLGKIPWNKGTKGIMKPNSTTWKKGNIPWNKGNKSPRKKKPTLTDKVGKDEMLRLRNQKISKKKLDHVVSKDTRQKISKTKSGVRLPPDKLQIKVSKQYLTRKQNNSFNTSQPEKEFYQKLLKENVNKTIYKQYKDKDRYPFYCDFYIKEDDLFIECNFHWTHGGTPYDPNDIECQKQLTEWQEKAKTSQFYQNAIITWTIRDVEKLRVAKQNNLNYKTIY